jgi:DNA repair protein RadD
MRVTYLCGLKTYDEWVPFESEKGRFIAEKWWRKHAGYRSPVPASVGEALDRLEELTWPREIAVKPEGKYWRVMAHKLPARESEVAA